MLLACCLQSSEQLLYGLLTACCSCNERLCACDCCAPSGGSVANCYNDVWVLDLSSGAWSKPDVVGPSPTPRAGHGGVLVGDLWYILGGGNNVKGKRRAHAAESLRNGVSNRSIVLRRPLPLLSSDDSAGLPAALWRCF
jgi:hypothetical protein